MLPQGPEIVDHPKGIPGVGVNGDLAAFCKFTGASECHKFSSLRRVVGRQRFRHQHVMVRTYRKPSSAEASRGVTRGRTVNIEAPVRVGERCVEQVRSGGACNDQFSHTVVWCAVVRKREERGWVQDSTALDRDIGKVEETSVIAQETRRREMGGLLLRQDEGSNQWPESRS